MATRRNRLLKVLAAGVVMGDFFARLGRILFEGARPIDRTILAVDALVLLVILAEYVGTKRKEWSESKRKGVIDKRLQVVRDAMQRGQAILNSAVPYGHADSDRWYQRLKEWTEETKALLEKYSSRAGTAFSDVSEALPMATYPQYTAPNEYANLVARLKNLRRIVENADFYL